MKLGRWSVCGGDHRIAWTAMLGEVTRYWKTTALLAEPWDPAAVLRFGVWLIAGTLLAALLPAWRAARATPVSLP
jgi:hypothetical protein